MTDPQTPPASDPNAKKTFKCPITGFCPSECDVKEKAKKLWAGDVPLVQTFWLYYFAVVFVLSLLAGMLGGFFSLLALAWSGFMVVPIMKAADKYQGEKHWAL